MDLGIKDKIALISASTSGIGFGTAKTLAQEGVTVYVNGRSVGKVDAAIKKLRAEKEDINVLPAPFDLSEKEGAEALFQFLPHVDILINNLGLYEELPLEEISDEAWYRLFKINVLSGIRLSKFYLPKMLQLNWGRIIFVSSEAAVNVAPHAMHYGVTKTMELGFSRGLAEMTKGTNVTVNAVLPGITRTMGVDEFIQSEMKKSGQSFSEFQETFFKTMKPTSLIKRFENIDEIANVIAFISSKLASGINGSAVHVEGGVIKSIV